MKIILIFFYYIHANAICFLICFPNFCCFWDQYISYIHIHNFSSFFEIWFIFFPLFLAMHYATSPFISWWYFNIIIPFCRKFLKNKNTWKKIYVLVIEKVIVSYIYILNLNESPCSHSLFYVFNSLYEF